MDGWELGQSKWSDFIKVIHLLKADLGKMHSNEQDKLESKNKAVKL